MIFDNYKRVLFTVHSFIDYAGAEINVLSLAEEFISYGCEVTIGCFKYDYPIKRLCEQKNIRVVNLIIEKMEFSDFDLVWSHHTPTLYHLLYNNNISVKKIVFSSLSPFEPFEYPPYFVNELSVCLANSMETEQKLINEGVEVHKIVLFPNYATRDFFQYKKNIAIDDKIKKIAVVSNHIPDEISEAANILRDKGVTVDIYGLGFREEFITPNILCLYDAVISIGKTVQYSLVMGLPVFCYDVHGGPGWLNRANYAVAKFNNFSGRGFNNRYEATKIVDLVIGGYSEAVQEAKSLITAAREEYNLTKNLIHFLEMLSEKDNVDVESLNRYKPLILRSHQAFMREYEYNYYRYQQLQLKSNEINNSKQKQEEYLEKLNTYVKECSALREELSTIQAVVHDLKDKETSNKEKVDELEQKLKNSECIILKKNNEIVNLNNELEREKKLVKEKENNCVYLTELSKEKSEQIRLMENTQLWKAAEKARKFRNKAMKVLKDPSLIVKKISKSKDSYAKKVNVNYSEENTQEIPLVSVVIPIYDRTDVLITSIESILNQSYKNIELLLVCDGSPRETLEIVKTYEDHPKVRAFYFFNNSGNAVRGRNKAIKEAKGKYLAFQDSDDIADIDRIKNSVEQIEYHNADIVYGGWRALVDGTRKINLENQQEVYSPDCDYELLKEICVPCQSTVMVRLSAIRHVGGLKPIMRYREDHELWLRLAYYGYKFKSIDKILTNLRLHENNLELSFKDDDQKWEKLTLEEHKIIRPLKPKIAYVIAGTGVSGGLAVISQHANGLLNRGFDVIFISEDGNKSIDWLPNQKVQVITLDEVPDNLDILIATYWTTAYTIQNIPAKKKYYFVQSDESKFFEGGTKEARAAMDSYKLNYTLITMAKWLQVWLEEEFNKSAIYVPNGVDKSVIHPVAPLIPKGNKLRVLLEGPIDVPFKNMEDAFKVVEDLDCEVWCISTAGRPKETWRCDMFFESVPMEKMKNIYSSCDVLLKMSSVESFCLPALEMMTCGGVPVLNRFNGLEEFAVHDYNALVVEKGDIKAAKENIQLLIDNRNLLEKLSKNALVTAEDWSWDRSIDILEKEFSQDT